MSKRSAWLCEYEQLCESTTSIEELQNLSVQYISRQREDLLSQVERFKAEAEHTQGEAERSHAEAEKLRDVLKRLRTELELRAHRFARTDHDDLRAIVSSGLRQTNCEAPVAEGSSGNIMKRLRARVEQLERANKRLEKECDTMKLQKLVAQRDLQRAGLDPGRIKNPLATSTGHSHPRSPRMSSRGLLDEPLGTALSPRATPSSPPRSSRNVAAPGESEGDVKAPTDERERRWTGERESLLAMVQHLEKEQVEQQQYADQVVNQLGHALRALEADNTSLQEESKQNSQKIGASMEARRKLERQLRQLRTEKEALTRQVLAMRSGSHSENKALGHPRQFRSARSKSPSAVPHATTADKSVGRTADTGVNGVVVVDKTVSQHDEKMEEQFEDEVGDSQQHDKREHSDSVELLLKQIQDLTAANDEVSPPGDALDEPQRKESWGLAWRSFESDGTLEDSPASPHLTPFTSSSTLAEVGVVTAEARQSNVKLVAQQLVEPPDLSSNDRLSQTSDPRTPRTYRPPSKDVSAPAAEDSRRGTVQLVEPESKDSVPQLETPAWMKNSAPAWASISVSPAEMLPRVTSPRRFVDTRARQGNGGGTSAVTNPARLGSGFNSNRSPRWNSGMLSQTVG